MVDEQKYLMEIEENGSEFYQERRDNSENATNYIQEESERIALALLPDKSAEIYK